MRRRLALSALLPVLLLAPPMADAAPRTIGDCEKIQDPHAYNLCLASFGPTRGGGGPTYPGVAAEPPAGAGAAHRGASYRPGMMPQRPIRMGRYVGRGVSYTRSGRVRMEFTPGR